jgi:hypothetical protein
MFTSILLTTLALTGEQPKSSEPVYDIKLRKAADTLVTGKEKDRTIFIVTSPGGIGGATMHLKSGQWPENVTLRLQYQQGKGMTNLENLTLTTERIRIEGDAKSSGKFRFWFLDANKSAGKREPAGTLNVIVAKQKDFMDVALPSSLLMGSSSVEISWVDVYR